MSKRSRQQGYNLVELMIAITLGILVLTAVTSLFISMIRSDADNMKMIRLSQELRAAMTLMSRDIRRAGGNSAINWNSTTFTDITATTTSLTFFYDADEDGVLDASDEFGFRHNTVDGTIEAFSNSTWNTLTDSNIITINTLEFDSDCDYLFQPGTIITRTINIELAGYLTADTDVRRHMTESIKIRNDNINSADICPP